MSIGPQVPGRDYQLPSLSPAFPMLAPYLHDSVQKQYQLCVGPSAFKPCRKGLYHFRFCYRIVPLPIYLLPPFPLSFSSFIHPVDDWNYRSSRRFTVFYRLVIYAAGGGEFIFGKLLELLGSVFLFVPLVAFRFLGLAGQAGRREKPTYRTTAFTNCREADIYVLYGISRFRIACISFVISFHLSVLLIFRSFSISFSLSFCFLLQWVSLLLSTLNGSSSNFSDHLWIPTEKRHVIGQSSSIGIASHHLTSCFTSFEITIYSTIKLP